MENDQGTGVNDIVARLRKPKAWMAWNDFGLVTINGDPIPPMEHDSTAPAEAADTIERLEADMEQCKLEVEAYWQAKEKAERDLARVTAERDAMKEDAERYIQHLKGCWWDNEIETSFAAYEIAQRVIDDDWWKTGGNAIDAAIAARKEDSNV